MRLIVHAPNVHQGGGRTLLLGLLEAGGRRGQVVTLLDARLRLPSEGADDLVACRVKPTLIGRLAGEWKLAALVAPNDTVLCFGNLPPLFRVPGRVQLLLQNRYLLRARSTCGLPWAVRLRIAVERRWLRARVGGVERIIVQSSSTAREVLATLSREAQILPFAGLSRTAERTAGGGDRRFDYLYVASGEPHKNHRRLLEAWALLAQNGLRPSLALTLDPRTHPELCRWIEEHARRHDSRVSLVGASEPERMPGFYTAAAALIHPSLFESFGLPLLEAREAGLPIIAAERDYVRDVIDPQETFDPESAMSIARAVRRHLRKPEARPAILSPDEFLAAVTSP